MAAAMAALSFFGDLTSKKSEIRSREPIAAAAPVPKVVTRNAAACKSSSASPSSSSSSSPSSFSESEKTILQPRLCTLRSYGSYRGGVIRIREDAYDGAASASESSSSEKAKINMQPRLCTLRWYGSDRAGVIKMRSDADGDGAAAEVSVSPFFGVLSEYVETWRRSQDFEMASGRLSMVVFSATLAVEAVTGSSVFGKTDVQRMAEAAGVCIGAVAWAAVLAWFIGARKRVGRVFAVGCSVFIDALVDQVVDGLFSDADPGDWSDEL